MTVQRRERYAPWALLVLVLIMWELLCRGFGVSEFVFPAPSAIAAKLVEQGPLIAAHAWRTFWVTICLLYTSPSPRDRTRSRMPSSA